MALTSVATTTSHIVAFDLINTKDDLNLMTQDLNHLDEILREIVGTNNSANNSRANQVSQVNTKDSGTSPEIDPPQPRKTNSTGSRGIGVEQ